MLGHLVVIFVLCSQIDTFETEATAIYELIFSKILCLMVVYVYLRPT